MARQEKTCMSCGQSVLAEGLDPCSVTVTNKGEGPREDRAVQEFWAHAACLRRALHESLVEDAYVVDPAMDVPEGPDGHDEGTEDLAPITNPWSAVSPWLRDLPVDASFLAEDIAWSPVFSPQPFNGGRREVEQCWGPGAVVAWLGGPAVPPLDEWPRRRDGTPLAHVASVPLAGVDDVAVEEQKQAFPEHREGLPTTGVLEVFHDLQTYGSEPGDGALGAWSVRWVAEPDTTGLVDPPDDLDPPSDACQAGLFFPGWSTRSPMDVAYGADGRFEAASLVTTEFQRAWAFQREGHRHGGPEVPVTHVYGHSQEGTPDALRALRPALPLEDGDEYRLVLDVEGWTTLDGWFGDGGMLEVWMRASDLAERRFDRAWCLIRQG